MISEQMMESIMSVGVKKNVWLLQHARTSARVYASQKSVHEQVLESMLCNNMNCSSMALIILSIWIISEYLLDQMSSEFI